MDLRTPGSPLRRSSSSVTSEPTLCSASPLNARAPQRLSAPPGEPPHGETAESIAGLVPKHRTNDVILFDVASREYVVGFNPLASRDRSRVDQVTSGVVNAFKKLHNSGGQGWMTRSATPCSQRSSKGVTCCPSCGCLARNRTVGTWCPTSATRLGGVSGLTNSPLGATSTAPSPWRRSRKRSGRFAPIRTCGRCQPGDPWTCGTSWTMGRS